VRPHQQRPTKANKTPPAAIFAGTAGVFVATAISVEQSGAQPFHARDLNLMMGSAQGTAIRFRVLIDEKAVGAAPGVDLDGREMEPLTSNACTN
jgi:hypothetical protein